MTWHAFPVHALVTAARDCLAERREDVADVVAMVRELVTTSTRVDLMSLRVSKLICRVGRVESRLQSFDERIKALEAATDTEAR